MATAAGAILVRIGSDLSGFDRGVDRAERRMGSFKSVASRAALGIVGGFGAIGVSSLKAAGDYEQSLNTFQAVSSATGTQMKSVSALAKRLGRDITLPATSAKDAAEAMTELAKGGLSVTQTMKAAKGVLQLSAAAQIENAEAATITARALKAFKLSGDQAVRVADVLANAANTSTGEIGDFALGLQQSSAVAKSWGLSINETTAALMQLADAGVVGSDAGTSLKTMLQSLSASTKPAREQMAAMGVDVFDANGKFVGMKATIGQFSDALKGMSQEQQTAALKTIFGSDAVRAANIILGEGAAAYGQYVSATERQGAAADLAAAKTRGFKGSLDTFKSTIETLQIELGQKLLPAATRAMLALRSFVDVASRHTTVVKVAALTLGTFAAAVLTVNTAMKIATATTAAYSTVQAALNLVMNANPFIRVATLLVTLGTALVVAYKTSERFRSVVNGAFNAVKGVVTGAVEAIKQVIDLGLVGALKAAAAAIPAVAASIGRAIIDGILSGLGGLYGSLKSKLEGTLRGVLSSLNPFSPVEHGGEQYIGRPLAEGALRGWVLGSAQLPAKMAESVREAVERARAMIESMRGRFGEAFSTLSGDALSAFDGVMAGIKTRSEKALAAMQAARDKAARRGAVTDAQDALATALIGKDGVVDHEAVKAAQKALDDALFAQREFALQQRIVQERKELDARIALQRRHLEQRLTSLSESLLKEGAKQAEANSAITKLLKGFGVDYKSSGLALGQAFAEGLREAESAVVKAAEKIARAAESRLKLRSPADKGPLSDLDSWWTKLGPTLASGMNLSPLSAGIDAALTGPRISGGGGGGRGGDVVFGPGSIVVQGSVIHERDLEGVVVDAVRNYSRNNGPVFSRTAGVAI